MYHRFQTAIQMPGFRSLREGEKVKVWYRKSHCGLEATKVSGPDGGNCKGCERRPKRRRRPDRWSRLFFSGGNYKISEAVIMVNFTKAAISINVD